MGIFAKLFGRFNKGIECAEMDQHIIYMHPKSSKSIKVNENITIDGNSMVVIVCKDRVADVLYPGKFKLNGTTMPETFRRLRLDRTGRSGAPAKNFKADIYFVNMKEIHDCVIDAYKPFLFKNTPFGKVKGYPEGAFNMKVVDPSLLVESLLAENPYIKNGFAQKQIQMWVGDAISQLLERIGMGFVDILKENDEVNQRLNESIGNAIDSIGISVFDIRLESIKLSRKQQEEISEYLANQPASGGEARYITAEEALQQVEQPTSVQETEIARKIKPFENIMKNNEPAEFNPNEFRRGSNPEFTNSNVKPTVELQTSRLNDGDGQKVCKYCGAKIDVNCKFCPECGFRQL